MTRHSAKPATANSVRLTDKPPFTIRRLNAAIVALLSLSGAPHFALALPQGETVTHGEAEVETLNSEHMLIRQHSQRAVINYESFSIDTGETVQIIQPNSEAALLNRVIGNNPSEIFGNIDANGHVFLINQSGIVFSESSQINVGGLTASTLDIENERFMRGENAFVSSAGGHSANIENRGQISAHSEGRIVFIAPEIINQGRIEAEGGEVLLASGNAVFVQDEDSPIALLIDEGAQQALIQNSGHISAESINLYAVSSDQLYTSLIDQRGRIQASSQVGEGRIAIRSDGDVMATGELSAASIDIEAARIGIDTALRADAPQSGGRGGEIRLQADDTLVLSHSSLLSANGAGDGDGGSIIAFSPDTTLVRSGAVLQARAGDEAGNGGFIETSGIQHIEFFGLADASAKQGAAGLVYIDPIDISIASGGSDNSFDGSFNWNPGSANGSAVIDPASIQAMLASGTNVTIDTASGNGGSGNITFNSSLDFDNIAVDATLSLIADNTISFASGVGIRDSNPATAENLTLVLTAGQDISMAANSFIDVADGTLHLIAGNNAVLSGLSSSSNRADAIRLTIDGDISDAGDEQIDISAVNGGLTADIGSLDNLEIQLANLNLNATGNVSLQQQNTAAIDIQTANVAGDFALAGSGQLTLSHSDHTLLGDVSFSTNNAAIVLPNSGLISFGTVQLNASEVRDSDYTVFVTGNELHLSQTATTNNSVLQTSIDAIAIDQSGIGHLTVSNTRELTLLDLSNPNNTTLISPFALVLQDSGVSAGNSLSIDARDLRSTSSREVSISANNLILGSELSGGDLALNTEVNTFSFTNLGSNRLSVVESDALSLNAVSLSANGSLDLSAGQTLTVGGSGIQLHGGSSNSLNLSSGGDLIVSNHIQDSIGSVDNTSQISLSAANQISIGDNISVNAGNGNLQLSATSGSITLGNLSSNLNTANAIQVSAGDQIIGGGQPGSLHLRATQGGVSLTAANGITDLNSNVAALGLNNTSGEIRLNNSGNLSLSSANLGSADLELSAHNLILPDSGLSTSGNIALTVRDLRDSDRTIAIAANELWLDISLPLADSTLTVNSDINRLQASLNNASLALRNAEGRDLEVAVLTEGSAINVQNGNLFIAVKDADLSVNGNILAYDNPTSDANRRGLIHLQVENGNLLVGTSAPVSIASSNTADQNLGGGLVGNDQTAVWLELINGQSGQQIKVGDDTAQPATSINARGGDIRISASGGAADLKLSLSSQYYADNSSGDPVSGMVIVNGQRNPPREPFTARSNRQISLEGNTDSALSGLFARQNGAIVIEAINDAIKANQDTAANAAENAGSDTVGRAFKSVFGDCETTREAGKCEVDSALESFLSKWTIGGELPPKVEVNEL